MKLNYLLLSMLILLTSMAEVTGQPDANLVPKIFPLSPNSANLNRYGDVPVSHYTGVPDISVPIFTIKSGNLEIPLTLKYHAGGIKVADVAGWVGLGWSLETGGEITRAIKGGPDDCIYGYLTNTLKSFNYSFDLCDDKDYLDLVYKNYKDTEPDIYSFSFQGKVGKFFFNGRDNYRIEFIPYSPIKINADTSTYNKLYFNVYDENGNYYVFGKDTLSTDISYSIPTAITSWKINSIISQNRQDTVTFNYTKHFSTYQNFSDWLTVTDYVDCFGNVYYEPSQGEIGNASLTNTTYESITNEIKYKNGKLVFNTVQRQDEPYLSKSLYSIEVFERDLSTGSYNLLRTIKFHHSYEINDRLMLDSLSIVDAQNSVIERYQFVYNTDKNLPARNSKGVDLWGYYNGREDLNTSLVPQQDILYNPYRIQDVTLGISTGNLRHTDSLCVQANILKRIYYPTGGYTDFEYEANRYTNDNQQVVLAGGVRIKSIKSYSKIGASPNTKTYVYGPGTRNGTDSEYNYFTTQFTETLVVGGAGEKRDRTYFSSPTGDAIPYDGTVVIYKNITEYFGDLTNNTGKILYSYSFAPDGYDLTGTVSSKERRISRFYERGNLQSKILYKRNEDGTYSKVHVETFQYDQYNTPFSESIYHEVGFTAARNCHSTISEACLYNLGSYLQTFFYAPYHIISNDNFLISKTDTIYDHNLQNKFLVNKVNYSYNNKRHQQISTIVTIDSEGDTLTVLNKYAADYIPTGNSQTNNNILDGMINSNMQSSLVETYTKRGDDIISAQLNLYKLNGPNNTIVQDTIKILSIENPSQDFDTTYLNVQHELIYDSNYETYVNFDYYSNNNLKQYTSRNSPVISVLWGYNNQYPVAKILNSKADIIAYSGFETNTDKGGWTYTGNPVYSNESFTGKGAYQLSGNITKSISDTGKYILQVWAKSPVSVSGATSTDLFSSSANSEGWRYFEKEIHITSPSSTVTISGNTLIDELRLFPGDAQMITYTYEPNIGISSQSDENNIPSFYEYDSFGRLKYIKDQDRNILGKYDYHYQSNQ